MKREAELSSTSGWPLSQLNLVSHVNVSEMSEDKATRGNILGDTAFSRSLRGGIEDIFGAMNVKRGWRILRG